MADNARILFMAQALVTQAHHFLKVRCNQNKKGGYLTVVNHLRGELVLTVKLGQVNKEETEKYEKLSCENAWRLYRNCDLLTSFECRDPDNGVVLFYGDRSPHYFPSLRTESWGWWGGAVRGERYIFSFSGFPEQIDEAVMFALAIKLGQLKMDFVLSKFGERNKHLKMFLDECDWAV